MRRARGPQKKPTSRTLCQAIKRGVPRGPVRQWRRCLVPQPNPGRSPPPAPRERTHHQSALTRRQHQNIPRCGRKLAAVVLLVGSRRRRNCARPPRRRGRGCVRCGRPAPRAGLLAAPEMPHPEKENHPGRRVRLHFERLMNVPHFKTIIKTVL